ncbi:DUF6318 family protein [Arthrobacter silvisoli]|uniref:DUF6318 family protein n=1 Tax=Arthrobacter silvisoli TaxID=2291022 RepID=UPI00109BD277|nr:DUF6318 family protein [Arthrobacter silvisoli]
MTARSFSFARGRVVAALVGVGLLLSACQGGSPTPGASPSASSTSASPSATPTPSPSAKYIPASAEGKAQNVPVPVKPALADQNSKAGLEAFTKYWFALLDYGYQTGDLKTWSSLTESACAFCDSLKSDINKVFSDKQWMAGGKLTTPAVEAKWQAGAKSQSVVVQVLQAKIDYFDSAGSAGTSSPASNTAIALIAKRDGEAWKVVDMGRLGS